MQWYNPKSWFANAEEKLNPAQESISRDEGSSIGTDALVTYNTAFEKLESVNRGVNMIVSACSQLDFDVKDKKFEGVVNGVRQKSLITLLNFQPNPFQSAQDFRVNIFTDFILEGNIFIYYDGVHLYHLPSSRVTIETDPKTLVKGYVYNGSIKMQPNEVMHVKDLSSTSVYRGSSRLQASERSIKTLYKMQTFQDQFFENGAIPGLIFTSENTLSTVAKEKTIAYWTQRWSPKNGARKPMILDSGLKPFSNLSSSFQEMDFDTSIHTHNKLILQALGVPPLLLDGGNNANIAPNLRLFYLETVLPILAKFTSAVERYFGYDVEPITSNVSALQPEKKDVAQYLQSLVNTGIMTPNEARLELRLEELKGHDDLRIPANIAGSAANPGEGGAPPKTPNEGAGKAPSK